MVSQGGHLLTWALTTPQQSRAVTRLEVTSTLWAEPWHSQPSCCGKGGWVPACSCIHCALGLGSGNAKEEPRAGAGHGTASGEGTMALLQSEEGPHYLQPLTHLPPNF